MVAPSPHSPPSLFSLPEKPSPRAIRGHLHLVATTNASMSSWSLTRVHTTLPHSEPQGDCRAAGEMKSDFWKLSFCDSTPGQESLGATLSLEVSWLKADRGHPGSANRCRPPTQTPVRQASVNFRDGAAAVDSQASPSLADAPPPWPRIKTCENQGPRHSDAQANSGDTVVWCWACPWVSDGRKKHHPGIESGPAVDDFLSRTQSTVLMSHKATQFKQWLRVPEHTGDKTQKLLFS